MLNYSFFSQQFTSYHNGTADGLACARPLRNPVRSGRMFCMFVDLRINGHLQQRFCAGLCGAAGVPNSSVAAHLTGHLSCQLHPEQMARLEHVRKTSATSLADFWRSCTPHAAETLLQRRDCQKVADAQRRHPGCPSNLKDESRGRHPGQGWDVFAVRCGGVRLSWLLSDHAACCSPGFPPSCKAQVCATALDAGDWYRFMGDSLSDSEICRRFLALHLSAPLCSVPLGASTLCEQGRGGLRSNSARAPVTAHHSHGSSLRSLRGGFGLFWANRGSCEVYRLVKEHAKDLPGTWQGSPEKWSQQPPPAAAPARSGLQAQAWKVLGHCRAGLLHRGGAMRDRSRGA